MSSLRARCSRPDQLDLAGCALAAGLFLASWGLVHTWFWGHGQLIDTPTYRAYGDAIVHAGRVPYRDFAIEYPPLALPAFVLPSLLGAYDSTFAWTMAVCGMAAAAIAWSIRPAAGALTALAPVLVGSLVLSRFDLWPVALVLGALAALVRGRHGLGWGLLGAAAAAKLWPLVLVPLALSWSWRRGGRRAPLIGLAVAVLAFVPFAILAPHGLWSSLRGQASRPLQVESLGSAFVAVFGSPHVVSGSGSQNIAGHGTLGTVLALAGAALVVATWLAFARGPATAERFLRYVAAAAAAFVAFDKVLSPQYLLWLVPLVPLVRGRRGLAATGILVAACVLTQVWFPSRYWEYALAGRHAPVVLARDLLLVLLALVLAWPMALRPARNVESRA